MNITLKIQLMKTFHFLTLALAAAAICSSCGKDDTPEPAGPSIPVSVWDGSTKTQPAGFTSTPGAVNIASAAELAWIAANCTATNNGFAGYTFTQTIAIDLDSKEWTPIGTPENAFKGTYDGGGHDISNLTFTGPGVSAGLFGYSGGTLKNIRVASGSVSGSNPLGNATAGLCGLNDSGGVITACHNAATVSVSGISGAVGGVCGINNGGVITACYNTGAVSGACTQVGGVCGGSTGTITACYNTGAVSGTGYSVAGVCGGNSGTITACWWLLYTGTPMNGIGGASFSTTAWPASTDTGWAQWTAAGDEMAASPKYWKTYGEWNADDATIAPGATPKSTFPKLWWE